MIVHRVSGSSLAEFSKVRLFEPLGMRSTSWRDDFRRIVPGRAIGYAPSEQVFYQAMPFEDAYGNAGLLTNVRDLLIWNEALSSERLGAQITQRLAEQAVLTDGRRISYGRGLFIQSYRGQTEIAHSGGMGGYRAWLGRYPGAQVSVALLCNSGATPATSLAQRVASTFLPPGPPPALPAAPGATAPPMDRTFAGTFVSERDGMPLQLTVEAGRPRVVGRPPLEPIGARRFQMGPAQVHFDDAGGLLMTADGDQVTYRRVKAYAPSARDLEAYAGRYESVEAGAAYVASVQGNQLNLRLEERPHIQLSLRPVYKDAFDFPEGVVPGGIVRFQRDTRGVVRSLSFGVPRVRDLRFVRIAATPPAHGSATGARFSLELLRRTGGIADSQ